MFLYFKPFIISFLSSLALVFFIIKLGRKYRLFDRFSFRKIHTKNIVRLGGAAIIISFLAGIFLSGDLVFDDLKWGIVACSLIILFLGVWDDFKNLSWKTQLIGQIIIVLVIIYAGLNVDYIANPFGGAEFRLDQYLIPDTQYSILGSLFILIWIVGFMNVMNWLDGLDGLAGGVSFIGAAILFFLSVSLLVNQPPLGIITAALAGAILGFLFYNFYPAKIFMGTSGSMFLGFMLATLAIFSGGKVATILLVMGLPILDAGWVAIQRIKNEQSVFQADQRHLHYRLLKQGWPQRKIILFMYVICLVFGLSALIFQTAGKLLAFLAVGLLAILIIKQARSKKHRSHSGQSWK